MTQEEMREACEWFEKHNFIHRLTHTDTGLEDHPDCTCHWCLEGIPGP